MALQTSYEFQEQVFEEAYIRIQKIAIGVSDSEVEVEHLDKITIEFKTEVETLGFAFVYANAEARKLNVRAINRIGFQFIYDYTSGKNIFEEAYKALKADLEKTNKVLDI